MARTFEGSEGVYIMLPTYFEAQDMFAENTRDLASLKHAVMAAGVPKVVFLSSIGAERETGTGAILKLHEMEEAFSSLPISTAAIRAGWFMENFHGLIPSAQETGVLWSFLDPLDLRVPMIATRDIGTLAAELLQQTWPGHRAIELSAEPALSTRRCVSLQQRLRPRDKGLDDSTRPMEFHLSELGSHPALF